MYCNKKKIESVELINDNSSAIIASLLKFGKYKDMTYKSCLELIFEDGIEISWWSDEVRLKYNNTLMLLLYENKYSIEPATTRYSDLVVEMLNDIAKSILKDVKYLKYNFYGKSVDISNMLEVSSQYSVVEYDIKKFKNFKAALRIYEFESLIDNIIEFEKLHAKFAYYDNRLRKLCVKIDSKLRGQTKTIYITYEDKFTLYSSIRELSELELYFANELIDKLNNIISGEIRVKIFKRRIPYREDMVIDD